MTALQPVLSATIDPARPSLTRPAGFALFAGAVGIVATSALYGLSPPHAAMPMLPLDLEAALAGAVRGRATMHAAGLFGVPGDVVVSASGLLLGLLEAAKGRGFAAMGWFLIAVSTVLFAAVDTLVGFVLPALAAAGAQQFLPAKILFDALFLTGTATFGAGAVMALLPHVSGTGEIPRLLAVPALLTGLVALGSGALGLLGVGVEPHVMGIGIAGGSVLFALIGLSLVRGRTPRV
ncbi:MAG: hypothetical protein J2P50_03445 [Hyphomicrobiaceae bacterium]|nr:hypothetical protein [Hyphomicrobiaceae bacterium]